MSLPTRTTSTVYLSDQKTLSASTCYAQVTPKKFNHQLSARVGTCEAVLNFIKRTSWNIYAVQVSDGVHTYELQQHLSPEIGNTTLNDRDSLTTYFQCLIKKGNSPQECTTQYDRLVYSGTPHSER